MFRNFRAFTLVLLHDRIEINDLKGPSLLLFTYFYVGVNQENIFTMERIMHYIFIIHQNLFASKSSFLFLINLLWDLCPAIPNPR